MVLFSAKSEWKKNNMNHFHQHFLSRKLKGKVCKTFQLHTETLKLVYFAYFHLIMLRGIIFWGNSTDRKNVFYIKNKIIWITAGIKTRALRMELLKKFNILPLDSKILLSCWVGYTAHMRTTQREKYLLQPATRHLTKETPLNQPQDGY